MATNPNPETIGPAILERLRRALDSADSWLTVETTFRGAVPEGEEETHRAFVFAFGYMLVTEAERGDGDGALAPVWVAGEAQFPPAIRELDDADVERLCAATEELDDPIARSRLLDILWERRQGDRPDFHARGAADAYLDVSRNEDWGLIDRADCVTRALELARSVGDEERQERVVARAVDLIREDLESEKGGPGVALTLAIALGRLDPRPDELSGIVDSAEQRYGSDPFIRDTLTDIRVAHSSCSSMVPTTRRVTSLSRGSRRS